MFSSNDIDVISFIDQFRNAADLQASTENNENNTDDNSKNVQNTNK